MTFKANSAKSTVTPLLTHQNRRQKVFNRGFTFLRGGFGFVRGTLYSKKDKIWVVKT